jgi:hypothetical protein
MLLLYLFNLKIYIMHNTNSLYTCPTECGRKSATDILAKLEQLNLVLEQNICLKRLRREGKF